MSGENKNLPLSNKIWWTRKARIQLEKRLLFNALHSKLLLLWYSFSSVFASIYYLKFNPESEYSNFTWVVFSVLVLCISCFINGFRFAERAGLVKECYEALSVIYEKSKQENESLTPNLSTEYSQILGACENHIEYDFYIAIIEVSIACNKTNNNSINKEPTLLMWTQVGIHYASKRFILLFLYFVPIGLFWLMEIFDVG